jgi:hypothetical protein
MPDPPFAEIRFRSKAAVPPIVEPDVPVNRIPAAALPKLSVPPGPVPTKLQRSWKFANAPTPIPFAGPLFTTRPRTVTLEPPTVSTSPDARLSPLSSTTSVGGQVKQLVPGCVVPSIVTFAGIGGSGDSSVIGCASSIANVMSVPGVAPVIAARSEPAPASSALVTTSWMPPPKAGEAKSNGRASHWAGRMRIGEVLRGVERGHRSRPGHGETPQVH